MRKQTPPSPVGSTGRRVRKKQPSDTFVKGKKAKVSRQRKTPPQKRMKGTKSWSAPAWMYYLGAGVACALLFIGFYYFFIQSYSYRWKPCFGMKAYGVCIPVGYQVHGFDISHHQGEINWPELQKTQLTEFPIRFVFLKASEGGDFSDSAFVRNFDAARKYGFIRGAYHFYNPNTDASRQADFFIRSVRLEPGDLPPVLDVERSGGDGEKLKKGVKVWLSRIEQHYHVRPILYTSYKFKERYLSDSVFNAYPYWIAHYYVDSVRYEGKWRFWQHTDVGRLPGISEPVDLNVFNGSLEELQHLAIQPKDSILSGVTQPVRKRRG